MHQLARWALPGVAGLALGCGDSNPAPKVYEKSPTKPTQDPEEAKKLMKESLKSVGAGPKMPGGFVMPPTK